MGDDDVVEGLVGAAEAGEAQLDHHDSDVRRQSRSLSKMEIFCRGIPSRVVLFKAPGPVVDLGNL